MRRELHLGQELYFVLWDEDSEEAGVAKGEVVQYAADYSKVRVKVVDAPQRTVIGRTTWVLPERLDDDPRSARRSYQRRAREQLRAELAAEAGSQAAPGGTDGEAGLVAGEPWAVWQRVVEGWRDVDLLIDTVDFEAGWPEHQARLAKFATLAVLRLRPELQTLLAAAGQDDLAEAVRASLQGGVLGAAALLAGADPCALLAHWDEVPPAEVAGAADHIAGLRAALDELAQRHGLQPALAAPAQHQASG